jgi:matrix metalloproteinase-14 (membrane-inserted)
VGLEHFLEADLTKAKDNLLYVLSYLKHYYRLPDDATDDEVSLAIKEFQYNANIVENGVGLKTFRAMNYPRCAHPDVPEFFWRRGPNTPATSVNKWALKELSYYIAEWVDGLTKQEQRDIYRRSYDSISAVCGIKFREVFSDNANLVILTSRAASEELGTPGNVLAYAYLPNSPSFTGKLTLTLDLAETWIDNKNKRGILLRNVHCHEVGHNLGLNHSKIQSALLAPYYNPNVDKPQENDDIPRLQRLYGQPQNVPPINPPPTPTPTPTPPTPNPTPNPSHETIIKIVGSVESITIPGYRVVKI